jgi:hypothetical protein
MAKIKEWWNTPLSKMFDDKEHIKYTVIVVFIVVAIIITLLFFARLRAESNTINIETEPIKTVETTVSQVNTNTNNQSIVFDTLINGTFGAYNNKIIMILIVGVFAVFMGTMVRRRMRIMMFVFIQGFCFIFFGLNVWAIVIPFGFLMASIISSELMF